MVRNLSTSMPQLRVQLGNDSPLSRQLLLRQRQLPVLRGAQLLSQLVLQLRQRQHILHSDQVKADES